jgi:hypothetical protein
MLKEAEEDLRQIVLLSLGEITDMKLKLPDESDLS